MSRAGVFPGLAARILHKLPFFYGWVIVYISFLALLLNGATSYWGIQVFVGPMHDDTGWQHTTILGALTIRFVLGGVCGFALGRFVDRPLGPPVLLATGVLIDAGSMAALYWIDSGWQFVALYGVIGGIGSTGVRLVPFVLVSKWFVTKRGSAVGIAAIGGAMSALLMVPVVSLLVTSLGWREAWPALALIMLVMMLPCSVLAIRAPEDAGLRPDGAASDLPAPTVSDSAGPADFSLGEAVETRLFWLLLAGLVSGGFALLMNTVVLVPYFEESGFSPGVAASAISVWGLFSIGSRAVWGYVADRLTAHVAIVIQALLAGGGAVLLMGIEGQASLYALAAFQGLIVSGFPTLSQLVWPEAFGRGHLGAIIGFTQLFVTFANAGGPLAVGLMHDSTGGYESSLWLMLAMWLACAFVLASARPLAASRAAQSR
jgi:MFS family permease